MRTQVPHCVQKRVQQENRPPPGWKRPVRSAFFYIDAEEKLLVYLSEGIGFDIEIESDSFTDIGSHPNEPAVINFL